MLHRNTWLALVVLAGLILFAIYLNNKPETDEGSAPSAGSDTQSLFSPEDGLATTFQIESAKGEIVKVDLGAEDSWYVRLPIDALADQSQAEAAASQIDALQKMADLELDKEAAGLAPPAYIITVGFTGGKSHTLEIGAKTPTEAGYYASLDGSRVLIVSVDGIDSLLGLLTSPPYLEPPTPSPVPVTNTPPPGQTEPALTVTPSP